VPRRQQRRSEATTAAAMPSAPAEHPRLGDRRVRALRPGGARVDRIAQRAGANKRMLYYYFGDKESLFLVALESATRTSAMPSARSSSSTSIPRGAAPAGGVHLELHLEHPSSHLPRQREPAQGEALEEVQRVREMHSPLVETLRGHPAQGERLGLFRRGRRPGAALHLDRRRGLFYLSNRIRCRAYRPRPDGAEGARGARAPHDRHDAHALRR